MEKDLSSIIQEDLLILYEELLEISSNKDIVTLIEVLVQDLKIAECFNSERVFKVERAYGRLSENLIQSVRHTSVKNKKTVIVEKIMSRIYNHSYIDDNGILVFVTNDRILRLESLPQMNDQVLTKLLNPLLSIVPSITLGEISKAVSDLTSQLRAKRLNDTLINLKGGHILNGKFLKGLPLDHISNFHIDVDYDAINYDLPLEINELIFHLVNDDNDMKEMLLDQAALIFLRNKEIRKKHGKLVRLYGPSSANGKSTLLELIARVVGESNSRTFTLKKLSDDQTLVSLKNCLFAYDADSPASYADDAASTNLKKIITADKLDARKIYSSTSNFTVLSSMFVASNYAFKSYDKTDAITRRLLPITTKKQLIQTKEWFDKLFSDKSVKSFRSFLITRARDISTGKHQVMVTCKSLERELTSFKKDNNNVLLFIEELGEDQIIGWTVKEVRRKYEDWCSDNVLTPLQTSNFNATIQTTLNAESKVIRFKNSKNFKNIPTLDQNTSDVNRIVRVWHKNSNL